MERRIFCAISNRFVSGVTDCPMMPVDLHGTFVSDAVSAVLPYVPKNTKISINKRFIRVEVLQNKSQLR